MSKSGPTVKPNAKVKPAPRAAVPSKKKPYSPPVLTCYGTVENLTRSQGNVGALDSGGGGINKTQIGNPGPGAPRRR